MRLSGIFESGSLLPRALLAGERRAPLGVLSRRKERWFYLLVSPWLFGFAVFQLLPLVGVWAFSFFDLPLPRPPVFVGLEHYSTLVSDPLFWRTLLNSAYYAFGSLPLNLAFGLLLALLLNRPGRFTAALRTLFFLPAVLNGVATTLLWGWVFNPQTGLVNSLLRWFGLTGPAWLADAAWALPTLILIGVWNAGVNMLAYLAGLQNVPVELLQAARIDGAGRWAQFRHVELPLLAPVTFYLLVANLIGAFQIFTPTYLLTRGGPDFATLTLPLYIYQNAFTYGRLGYAAALGLALLVCLLALTWTQFRFLERRVFYQGAGSES